MAWATLLPAERVSLATRDKAAIAELACQRRLARGDTLEATHLLGTNDIHVAVTCEPAGDVQGHPALKVGDCDNTAGRWTCRTAEAIRLKLAGKDIVVSYDSSLEIDSVVEIANYAASVRSFNGYDVAASIAGKCFVDDGRSVPFEGAVSFNFGCGGWSGTITKDCGGEKCRLFFTQWAETIV
jgi:hypothetical protein